MLVQFKQDLKIRYFKTNIETKTCHHKIVKINKIIMHSENLIYAHHKINLWFVVFADKNLKTKYKMPTQRPRKRPKKSIDLEIADAMIKLNALLDLNIFLATLRLAGINMDLNTFMRMYNGNKRHLRVLYQNIPGT